MISRPLALIIIIIIPTNTLPSLLSQCLTINSVERKRKKYSSFWPQCNEKKHRKQQKMLAALFWTTKNKKFSLVTCDFLDWMTYYWKRKIMSKTIIITIHFPILFIIIISLFTFYLSFIFCAITLINSILKKIPFFSCLYTSSIFVFTSFQSFAYIRW